MFVARRERAFAYITAGGLFKAEGAVLRYRCIDVTEENKPRLTLCVPTVGRVEFLADTIDSIARQTCADYEVLALDNATSAECAERLEAWARADRRVRVLRCETRIPMFPNFNRGVRAARGDYLAFCHDDDRLRPSFVERATAFLDAHRSVAFAGSNYDVIDAKGDVTGRVRPIAADGVWGGLDYIDLLVRRRDNPLTMQSIFYRTSVLREEGFDESLPPYYGDFVVLMRMAETHDVGHVAAPLVEVRSHGGQASGSMTVCAGLDYRVRLLGAYCDEYAGRWPGPRAEALRAAHHATLRRAFLRAWLEASSPEEGRACLEALAEGSRGQTVRAALVGLERIGLSQPRRRRAVETLLRARRLLRSAIASA